MKLFSRALRYGIVPSSIDTIKLSDFCNANLKITTQPKTEIVFHLLLFYFFYFWF